jgi:hypothetical protein
MIKKNNKKHYGVGCIRKTFLIFIVYYNFERWILIEFDKDMYLSFYYINCLKFYALALVSFSIISLYSGYISTRFSLCPNSKSSKSKAGETVHPTNE